MGKRHPFICSISVTHPSVERDCRGRSASGLITKDNHVKRTRRDVRDRCVRVLESDRVAKTPVEPKHPLGTALRRRIKRDNAVEKNLEALPVLKVTRCNDSACLKNVRDRWSSCVRLPVVNKHHTSVLVDTSRLHRARCIHLDRTHQRFAANTLVNGSTTCHTVDESQSRNSASLRRTGDINTLELSGLKNKPTRCVVPSTCDGPLSLALRCNSSHLLAHTSSSVPIPALNRLTWHFTSLNSLFFCFS